MHFSLITLFPEFFSSPLKCGLLGRAVESELISFSFFNPREFSQEKHGHVDDRPYGGGPGMVMAVDPVRRALQKLPPDTRTLMLSPKGRPLTQAFAQELAQEKHVALLCGRYEGFDARLEEFHSLESVSVGDFVLNGGESGALCLVEAVSRLVPEFMGRDQSADEESFSDGLLEYPHYTRPENYEGSCIPAVLASGNHAHIASWRREQSLLTTLKLRPDLFQTARLSDQDLNFLRQQPRPRLGRNLFVALVHHPVENKSGQTITTSLTNLDLHDIARVSCTYGLGGYYICTPVEDQQELATTLVNHWQNGPGAYANPDRKTALQRVRIAPGVEEVLADITTRTGVIPQIIATSAKAGTLTVPQVARQLEGRPVLLLLGTGHGLARELLSQADGVLRAIRFMDTYNHLSVRSAAAILVDRLLGDMG